jgi:hypothetical protein
MSITERREEVDRCHIEPIVFVARRDELSEGKVEAIHDEARRAAARVRMDGEHRGSGGIDYPIAAR